MIGSENWLCSEEDVKEIAGFNALQDVRSEEIQAYISDATQEVYESYGEDVILEPEEKLQAGSAEYDLSTEYYPIYKVEKIELEDDSTQVGSVILDSGSYEVNKARGKIRVTDDIHQDFDGNYMTIYLVPYLYHALVKNVAGYELLSNTTVMDGEGNESPRLRRLGSRITKYKNELKPDKVFRG